MNPTRFSCELAKKTVRLFNQGYEQFLVVAAFLE